MLVVKTAAYSVPRSAGQQLGNAEIQKEQRNNSVLEARLECGDWFVKKKTNKKPSKLPSFLSFYHPAECPIEQIILFIIIFSLCHILLPSKKQLQSRILSSCPGSICRGCCTPEVSLASAGNIQSLLSHTLMWWAAGTPDLLPSPPKHTAVLWVHLSGKLTKSHSHTVQRELVMHIQEQGTNSCLYSN